jgi:hypothetical protein
MVFQEPRCAISIGIFHAAGLAEVPDAMSISCMAAGFMSTIDGMFIPGIFIPGIWVDI